jgi:hypothetical protein
MDSRTKRGIEWCRACEYSFALGSEEKWIKKYEIFIRPLGNANEKPYKLINGSKKFPHKQ